ncbi:MAG: hypothetical protein JO189_26710, partial [Deltaproteobacteria bacterium]|nr:hypothetical protein [Deltaproteobacteria bacterium]
LLGEQGVMVPLMLICTARPEFNSQWPMRSHHTQITLNRLSVCDVREMVALVAARNALASDSVEAVIERTGGVPLFVEELTRAVLESSGVKLSARAIPVTLHDSLMARLDRLGSAKSVLQLGSVIGGEFSFELLRAVHPGSDSELESELRKLTDADLLYFRGMPPYAIYQFKHALIRDAAYEALLKSRRKELHRLIGERVEKQFSRIGQEQPEFVAYHYTAAGVADRALHYLRRAAREAIERSAHHEAIAHLNQGLALIKQISHPANQGSEELQLQLMLINPLIAAFGYAAPEVERASLRARELCEQLGDYAHRFRALGALCNIYQNRGDCDRAYEIAEQMMSLAEAARNREALMWAHYALAFPLQEWGDFRSSRYHFEKVIALYDSSHRGFVQDAGATARSFLAHALFRLGYPDQALHRVDEALTLARRRGEPYTQAMVLGHAGVVWMLCGELYRAQEMTEQMVAICAEQGFGFLEAMGKIWLGGILAKRGKCETAISSIRDGLGKYARTDAGTDANWERAALVRAYLTAGRGSEALNELTALRRGVQKYRKHALEADMHQFMGEILLQLGGSDEAEIEHCFRQAIEVARRQCAKSMELSATISLVRLLMMQDRRDEARALLAEIYNWFTEGFDTADLKDAKVLLDQLGKPS